MEKISDIISFVPSSMNPLSAEVVQIELGDKTCFFDVGASEAALEAVLSREGEKIIVISHFHQDHMENLSKIITDYDDMKDANGNRVTLYVGAHTLKYTKAGIAVTQELLLGESVPLRIIPIPCTHAKGALGLEVNGEVFFLGDAMAPATKNGQRIYNQQFLAEEMRVLGRVEAPVFIPSHVMPHGISRGELLAKLQQIYDMRRKDDPYIWIERT